MTNNIREVLDVTETCRICLSDGAIKNIYFRKKSKKPSDIPCNVMISSLFSMSVNPEDGLPSKLCKKCYSKLLSAYKLKLLAEDSLKKLLSLSKNVAYDSEHVTEITLDVNNTIKQESEIKREIEEVVILNGTIIKDECLEKVFSFPKSDQEIEINEDIKQNEDSDYDVDDDTPLVFYTNDEKPEEDFLAEDNEHNENVEPIKKKPRKSAEKRKRKIKTKKEKIKFHGPSICDLCGKLVMNIKAHSEIHSENRRKFPCGDCPKLFSTYGARKKHRNVHHLGNLYHCEICNKTYKRKYDHIRAKHQNRPKQFACLLCDTSFLEKTQLTFHMTSHTKERPFSCDICGKSFRSNACCKFHKRRVHDKEKTHMCQFCPKGFFSKNHLNVHMRSHTKEKIYKCTQCNKSFSTTSGLSIHRKRHLGLKKFSCQICSSSFVCHGSLRTHMISHTKERRHACKYCGVKFGRTDHRNRHEKTAHKDKFNVILTD